MSYEFWGLTNYNRWLRTPSGRSKRTIETKEGMYVIVHVSTGKFITGYSKTVSKTVDTIITQLDNNIYKNKKFNITVSLDTDLELIELPCTEKQYKRNVKLMNVKIPEYYNYLNMGK